MISYWYRTSVSILQIDKHDMSARWILAQNWQMLYQTFINFRLIVNYKKWFFAHFVFGLIVYVHVYIESE